MFLVKYGKTRDIEVMTPLVLVVREFYRKAIQV